MQNTIFKRISGIIRNSFVIIVIDDFIVDW